MQNQIAVIVQGPILGLRGDPRAKRITQQGLLSVRRHLPAAEIVLSTWEGSDVRDLEFDRLIASADPGTTFFQDEADVPPLHTNLNRMIVSTIAGLRTASRPYALKARSDLWMSSAVFLITTIFTHSAARRHASLTRGFWCMTFSPATRIGAALFASSSTQVTASSSVDAKI